MYECFTLGLHLTTGTILHVHGTLGGQLWRECRPRGRLSYCTTRYDTTNEHDEPSRDILSFDTCTHNEHRFCLGTQHTHTHTYSTFKQHQVWSKRVFIFQYCWVYLSARVILLYIKIKFNSFFNKYNLQSVSHKYTFLSYCLGIDVRRV